MSTEDDLAETTLKRRNGSKRVQGRKATNGAGHLTGQRTRALPEIVEDDWESDEDGAENYGANSDNSRENFPNSSLLTPPDVGEKPASRRRRKGRRRRDSSKDAESSTVDSALVIRSLQLVSLSEDVIEELLAMSLDLNRRLRAEVKRRGSDSGSSLSAVTAHSVRRMSKLTLPAVTRRPPVAGSAKDKGAAGGGKSRRAIAKLQQQEPWNDRFGK